MIDRVFSVVGSLTLAAACCGTALAQPGPDYGIDFVTVRAPGNAPINDPNPPDVTFAQGRGAVNYEYRIGRTEITSAQWVSFLNAYAGQASPNPFWSWDGPIFWGGGGSEFTGFHVGNAPNAGMFPVTGITWRMGAMYTNWLHNGQGSSPAALETGAYDTTTWGNIAGGGFTDAANHLPGARFWIPTLDEQLKAMHYDPNRNGPGQGGYWTWRNSADGPGISGPPGVGTTSNGYHVVGWGEWAIPLGAYPASLSPWGLLDTSGGTTEWSEEVVNSFSTGRPTFRRAVGSAAGEFSTLEADFIHAAIGSVRPNEGGSSQGFRIASAVPAPGTAGVLTILIFTLSRRRRNDA
jgi:formylglycine-generating enzyme required for sulfatase activity